jgi:hypothetical protein
MMEAACSPEMLKEFLYYPPTYVYVVQYRVFVGKFTVDRQFKNAPTFIELSGSVWLT